LVTLFKGTLLFPRECRCIAAIKTFLHLITKLEEDYHQPTTERGAAMDIKEWPELIMSFGPYAVFVLFALWIAPRLLKECYKQEAGFDKKLSGCIAGGAWLVVVSMVTYILFSWPPTKVYDGRIAILDERMEVFTFPPSKEDLYVKIGSGGPSNINAWDYALIVKADEIKNKNTCAIFTINWISKDNEEHAVDLEVPLRDLMESLNFNFEYQNHSSEGDVFFFRDGKWTSQGSCGEAKQAEYGFFRVAYADHTPMHSISQGLQSTNKVTRSKARKGMRRLSVKELNQLIGMVPSGSSANNVINKELARRQM